MSLMFPQPTEGASYVTQMVENLPEMWETWARSLGREGPLVEGMATHSSILAWRIPQRSLVSYWRMDLKRAILEGEGKFYGWWNGSDERW